MSRRDLLLPIALLIAFCVLLPRVITGKSLEVEDDEA